ncbi:1-acyl-sn-glycerol-3-phosphate acyltransferase [Ancylomarina sp. 16SWW S1-10-2]|uniref:1-acyl-sn-glycerol-3-phosphate acyltransferase n=1 Tax=Ancylomarina sp. 16SWW S1-10-2 TaxID=2499681 RepID=UPI0012AD7A48|nr:1-acyl-sn-glycerol-3-phosphate acyltransferase [Ancylomarina sp. 16SWW S1-10-2]MRT94095.1 glycerol acyltransferase [Ancylomarina sp. 16SWW S1-10-2]
MKVIISRFILKLSGWKFVGEIPSEKKAVVIAAPHTSNWDFIWGKLAFVAHRINTTVLMKKEFFFFPLGAIFRSMGVMPIDRSKKNNLTDQLAAEFKNRDELYLSLSPEASRSRRPVWKRGFYFIALKANVPILLGDLNYETKTLSFIETFHPTGDVEADMAYIKSRYKNSKPKFPDMFSIGD